MNNKKNGKEPRHDLHSVKINTAHFDAVKCECFVMEKVIESHGLLKAQKSTNPVVMQYF